MSKRKYPVAVLPWMTARADCKERRFLQVGNTLLLSKKFQALRPGARMLYLSMAMESGGRRGFQFPLSAARKYGLPSTSLRRYVRELTEEGFLTVQSNRNLRAPNLYAFTSHWQLDADPSHGNI